jgi:hypothetical protein
MIFARDDIIEANRHKQQIAQCFIRVLIKGFNIRKGTGGNGSSRIFLVFKILLLSVVVVVGMKLILPNEVDNFAELVASSIVILFAVTLLYGIILSNSDRQYVLRFVKNRIHIGSN